MADKVRSISAKQLAAEVKAAVAKNEALKGLVVDPKVVTFPPWILGLILRPGDLQNQPLAQVQKLAAGVAESLPSARGRTPATLVHGGHILIGYVEEPVVTVFEQ